MKSRKSFLLVVIGFIVILAGASFFYGRNRSADNRRTGSGPDVNGQPAGINELPAVDKAAARQTAPWLNSEGRPLVDMVNASKELLASPLSTERCRTTTARVEKAAPAARMLELTAGVTDEPLRALLQAERSSLLVVLSDCLAGRPTAGPAATLGQQTDLALARLQAIQDVAR